MQERTFTKDGKERTAFTVEQAVKLKYDGWREVRAEADVVDADDSSRISGSSQDLAAPPRSGEGSGRPAWLAYASEHVDVPDDATRDEIIDQLDAAGVPTD